MPKKLFSFAGRKAAAENPETVFPPPQLWKHNAIMIERLAVASRIHPVNVMNRLVELACNRIYESALSGLFAGPMLVASKIIPPIETPPETAPEPNAPPEKGDASATAGGPDAMERLHRLRVIAGVEKAYCRKHGDDPVECVVRGDSPETTKIECPKCESAS